MVQKAQPDEQEVLTRADGPAHDAQLKTRLADDALQSVAGGVGVQANGSGKKISYDQYGRPVFSAEPIDD